MSNKYNHCIECQYIHGTEHEDPQVGEDETYWTFWCRLKRSDIHKPCEQSCPMYRKKQQGV